MKRNRTLKTLIITGLAAAGFAGLGAGTEAETQVPHRVSDATYEKDPSINVPKLFGTTENAVYTQLYAALSAYVLLKWLHQQEKRAVPKPVLSFVGFQRLLLQDALPISGLLLWRIFCIGSENITR